MDLSRYTLGTGADVSREKSKELLNSEIKNVKHVFIEPDNFYSLRDFFNYESLDFIYSEDIINSTKFHGILLKEWFNFCRVNGYIILKFKENRILDLKKLKEEIKLLFQDKARIEEEFTGLHGEIYIALKKLKESLKKSDSIEKWSFGIITMGDKDSQVDKEIESIKNLNIPYFEVIICGKYNGKFKKDKKVVWIDFDENVKPGWITKKKNMIAERVKYENMVITHDRYTFNKNWYDGMKKYGNYFEVLSCIIFTADGIRAGDWITYGTNWDNIARLGYLDYKDWDKYGVISGGLYILKKSVWEKAKWDEELIWGEAEDIFLSKDWAEKGIISRLNPYSEVTSLTWGYGNKWREYKFDKQKLGKIKGRRLSLFWYIIKQSIKTNILGKNKYSYKG